jgi:hypothetical protein
MELVSHCSLSNTIMLSAFLRHGCRPALLLTFFPYGEMQCEDGTDKCQIHGVKKKKKTFFPFTSFVSFLFLLCLSLPTANSLTPLGVESRPLPVMRVAEPVGWGQTRIQVSCETS